MRVITAGRHGVAVDGRRTLEKDVRCLIGDGISLWAGTQGDGVWRSRDAGATWRHAGLEGEIVKCLEVSGGTLYAGTKPPRVWVWRAERWNQMAPFPRLRSWWWRQPAERPSTPYVSAIAKLEDALIAGIEAGAVVRTTNDGRTWSGHGRRASRDCHELFVADGRVYEVGGTGPMRSSDDAGATWRPVGDGAPRYGWCGTRDAAGRVYVVAAPVLRAHSSDSRAHVYRLDDGHWRSVRGPTPSLPRVASTPTGELLLVERDGTASITSDEGTTWSELPFRLPSGVRALVVLP
jgi:hypothetical protein